MAYRPLTDIPQQFFDALGNPLSGGTLYAYLAGTSTPTNLYSDNAGTSAGTSVTLDSRGEPTTFKLIWLDTTKIYKLVLKDSLGSTIWTVDNISGDDGSGSTASSVFDQQTITAMAGQTLFNLGFEYVTGTNAMAVYKNGARLITTTDFTETSSTSVTLTQAAVAGDEYTFIGGQDVSSSFSSSNVSFLQAGTGAVTRSVQTKLREFVSVKDFGAVGDGVTDDTAAIQAAIDDLSNNPGLKGRALFFPPGVYRTTSTLTVDSSGFALIGANEKGAVSFSPTTTAGSHILYDSNDGGPILKIGANSVYRYHNKIHGLRIGASSGLSVKPIGVQMNVCSEFSLTQFHINSGCSVGLALNACGIGRIQNFDISGNDIGIDMYVDTAVSGATLGGSLWFQGANVWASTNDAVRIRGNHTGVVFRDSWLEFAENIFHLVQQSDVIVGVQLQLHNVRASVGGGGAADSRFIRCRALDGGTNPLRVFLDVTDCETFNNAATHNIVYTKGTNSSAESYLSQGHFHNCTFYGASAAVLTSDTATSTAFFTGYTDARSGYSSGSIIPLADGSARLHKMTSAFGYWDMDGSLPIKLPTVDALSFANTGQFYFQATRNRLAFTANGSRILMPRPFMTTYGDEDVTVDVMTGPETLRFNTPLTNNRAVTISTTNAYNGAKFRVFRTASATGAFNLTVAGLKTLNVSEWCDIEHDGSAWRLTAFGSL